MLILIKKVYLNKVEKNKIFDVGYIVKWCVKINKVCFKEKRRINKYMVKFFPTLRKWTYSHESKQKSKEMLLVLQNFL